MKDDAKRALSLMEEKGQQQVFDFYDRLSDEEKDELIAQIDGIDWEMLEAAGADAAGRGHFEPVPVMELPEIEARRDELTRIGLDALHRGKVGAVLLAGGQGTRLGFDKPKGMFNIGISRTLYIFECLFSNLAEVSRQAGAWLPLYIMTSDKNHEDTVSFLREQNYFGYNGDYVHFFRQAMAPCTDFDGKILLEAPGRIATSPNGNGGWFSSLCRAGLDRQMREAGIEWLSAFAVDNVLQKINDPAFIGAVLSSGADCGGMVVRKADPQERVGVICLEDGRPSIVEYYEMTDDMVNLRDDSGNLLYNFGVILNYLFRLDRLEEIAEKPLPLHRAAKKIPCIASDGTQIKPAEPNGYKYETLILDMIHMMNGCCAFEVERDRAFAPVKNLTGVDSVESARKLLEKNGIIL